MKEAPARVRSILAALDIPEDLIRKRSLPLRLEAEELELAEVGDDRSEYRLMPAAAAAWRGMKAAAAADGVVIRIASAFRSIDRQVEILREKLARGVALAEILSASAPPGYSEHHTGRAIDITTDGVMPFEMEFENTPAFAWLMANAARFGFILSFPPRNRYGYQYEPWHWFYGTDGTRIDCGRCVVRDWLRSDKESLLHHANNREVWRNLTDRFPHPHTDADAQSWFALLEAMPEVTHWAIEVDGQALGGIGAIRGEGERAKCAQFGYWLGEAYWGRGIMTAAVKAVVPYAMERLRLVRLESPVFEWNPASMRVLEKCGFTREAVLKASVFKDGQLIDSVLYAFVDTTRS